MASIALSTLGSSIGAATGIPFASQLGGMIGSSLASGLGGTGKHHFEGARLENLAIQTSTYGRMIPMVFGSVRIAGNVIWSRPIKELVTTTTTTQGGGGKGGGGARKSSSSSTTYSYYVTLAIAICEGELSRVNRVWADSQLLDLSQGTYRIYKGTETQLPDPLIETYQGVGATPAYRGLAYVVIEDFPMADFGNRIPNFTFEVTRKTSQNAGTGDITIGWQRRTRIDGNLHDYVDVPLMEQNETYDVQLMNGVTVLRSWQVTSPVIVYASAEQTADFGSAPSSLTLSVTQRSALIGPGKPLLSTVTVQ